MCGGGREASPDIYWYLGHTRLVTDTAVVTREDNVTGGEVTASVTILTSRDLLQVSLQCKVANQAMADTAMTASVTWTSTSDQCPPGEQHTMSL